MFACSTLCGHPPRAQSRAATRHAPCRSSSLQACPLTVSREMAAATAATTICSRWAYIPNIVHLPSQPKLVKNRQLSPRSASIAWHSSQSKSMRGQQSFDGEISPVEILLGVVRDTVSPRKLRNLNRSRNLNGLASDSASAGYWYIRSRFTT